jgi:hypothetical protein
MHQAVGNGLPEIAVNKGSGKEAESGAFLAAGCSPHFCIRVLSRRG